MHHGRTEATGFVYDRYSSTRQNCAGALAHMSHAERKPLRGDHRLPNRCRNPRGLLAMRRRTGAAQRRELRSGRAQDRARYER
jgi:hypothetical protein